MRLLTLLRHQYEFFNDYWDVILSSHRTSMCVTCLVGCRLFRSSLKQLKQPSVHACVAECTPGSSTPFILSRRYRRGQKVLIHLALGSDLVHIRVNLTFVLSWVFGAKARKQNFFKELPIDFAITTKVTSVPFAASRRQFFGSQPFGAVAARGRKNRKNIMRRACGQWSLSIVFLISSWIASLTLVLRRFADTPKPKHYPKTYKQDEWRTHKHQARNTVCV